MHELSICQSISQIAMRAAAGRPVSVIHLDIGKLRQIVPETLTYCWGLVTAGGALDGSHLDVRHLDIELLCRSCGDPSTVGDSLVLVCPLCDGGEVDVVRGDEFLITTIDLKG